MRRSHRKSRLGCSECKKRHMRCDESRPACLNCTRAQRSCSFLSSGASRPAQPHSQHRDLTAASSSEPYNASSASPSPDPTSGPDAHQKHFTLRHLELMHHFEHHMANDMQIYNTLMYDACQLALVEGFASRYVMDQVLAIAAAHKASTLTDAQARQAYHLEATSLQTRAVALFTAETADAGIPSDKAMAAFTFASFLGLHVLYDLTQIEDATWANPTLGLDQFTHYFKLLQGIRKIATPIWDQVSERVGCDVRMWDVSKRDLSASARAAERRSSECSQLLALLDISDVTAASREVLRVAIDALIDMFESGHQHGRWVIIAQEWPTRATPEYNELVARRRPEALVVLAHFSVLLHRGRDFWCVGDAGSRLFRCIKMHLGEYWAKWLEWPEQQLQLSPARSVLAAQAISK
ncbi:uncharacterized protein B0I36DRAFT_16487 [Microdochium trichocladiopsis]|uniref:Zn(2)-C6 fungal-type domain-containing protein n=1 Tax=Microdochium trichocladiopsis TaxID=1682393 RepID=A0A9P8YK29_9PEZI|nr:uncharacterized protein B0I36DRAFT_16487 [Microdochium trichocladiopsis]KAH7040891.1 hypothetical protein B0I36DRAFT_16487 [Microdochium trichocladiopsis]